MKKTNIKDNKRKYMLRAIELARKGAGKTFPNPMVGAVLAKGNKIIAEGYHKKFGMPHAEIEAIKKAGKKAKGATLYVSLEPCTHYGKTPPCVNSIIKNKIKEVFVAMKDPNPLVNGRGLQLLRKNNVKVKCGICEPEARELNIVYLEFINFKYF